MGCRGCPRIPASVNESFGPLWMVAYLRHSVLNDLLVRHIALVANKQLVDALSCISVNLLQPLLHVVEGVHVCDIVDNADAVGASVV